MLIFLSSGVFGSSTSPGALCQAFFAPPKNQSQVVHASKEKQINVVQMTLHGLEENISENLGRAQETKAMVDTEQELVNSYRQALIEKFGPDILKKTRTFFAQLAVGQSFAEPPTPEYLQLMTPWLYHTKALARARLKMSRRLMVASKVKRNWSERRMYLETLDPNSTIAEDVAPGLKSLQSLKNEEMDYEVQYTQAERNLMALNLNYPETKPLVDSEKKKNNNAP